MDLKQFFEGTQEKLNSFERRLQNIFLSPHLKELTVGDAVNYTEIKNDGEINLHGTARVIAHVRIAAPTWHKGAIEPQEGFVGVFPVLKFDSGHNDDCHYSTIVPYRMFAGATIQVLVDWCYTGGADAGTVCWKLEYKSIEAGEALVGGTTTITATSPGGHTSGQLVRTTLLTGVVGAVSHDILGLRLYRDSGVDTLVADAELIQVHFMFLMDKLGNPT